MSAAPVLPIGQLMAGARVIPHACPATCTMLLYISNKELVMHGLLHGSRTPVLVGRGGEMVGCCAPPASVLS